MVVKGFGQTTVVFVWAGLLLVILVVSSQASERMKVAEQSGIIELLLTMLFSYR
jgi:hypothetical protein